MTLADGEMQMVAAAGFEPALRSQKQILSPPDAVLPNPFCGRAFHLQSQETLMTST
jgi:hypothetical protein